MVPLSGDTGNDNSISTTKLFSEFHKRLDIRGASSVIVFRNQHQF